MWLDVLVHAFYIDLLLGCTVFSDFKWKLVFPDEQWIWLDVVPSTILALAWISHIREQVGQKASVAVSTTIQLLHLSPNSTISPRNENILLSTKLLHSSLPPPRDKCIKSCSVYSYFHSSLPRSSSYSTYFAIISNKYTDKEKPRTL